MLKEAKIIHKTGFMRIVKHKDNRDHAAITASSTSVQSLFDEDDRDDSAEEELRVDEDRRDS